MDYEQLLFKFKACHEHRYFAKYYPKAIPEKTTQDPKEKWKQPNKRKLNPKQGGPSNQGN